MRAHVQALADAITVIADGINDRICHVANASNDAENDIGTLRAAAVEWLTSGRPPAGLPADHPAAEALATLRAAGPTAWITAYEALSALHPVVEGGRMRLVADRQARKRRGSWYTPQAVVEAALDHGLEPALAGLDATGLAALRILDPAAGPGPFLLGAARRITARLDALGVPDARRIALGCLWGADLDPGALALARAVLEDFAGGPDPTLAERLLCGDALRAPLDRRGEGPAAQAVQWVAHAPFDVVLGNPPYRAGRLAGFDAEVYRGVIPTAEYQLDPFALFLDRAARLARRRVALLVPTTWMSNHRMRALRGWLLTEHRLEVLLEVPVETFDAAVETAVAVFAVGQGPTPGPVPVLDLAGARVATVHADARSPRAPLPLTRSPRAAALLRAAQGWPGTLGQVCEINRGINPYHHTTHTPAQIKARVHHSDHRVDRGWSPELRGRGLPGPYRRVWRGDAWIHYGPWLKEPRAARFFEGPRLLVRKILGETLHAVYVEEPLYCDQSIYIARIGPDCPYPPFALLACINSRLIATLIRTRHQTHRTHFPQLKVGELRAMPLPPTPPDDPRWAALAEMAARMQAGPDAALTDAIEAAVEALYGV